MLSKSDIIGNGGEIEKELVSLGGRFERSGEGGPHHLFFGETGVHVAVKLNKEKLSGVEVDALKEVSLDGGNAVVLRYWSGQDIYSLSEYHFEFGEMQPIIGGTLTKVLGVVQDMVLN